jgi:predicted  nucleic acid-binding Zn ribbon protein
MIFYQISFGQYSKSKYDEAKELIEDYLQSLMFNCQISNTQINESESRKIMAWNGEIVAYVYAQDTDASMPKYHSHNGKEKLELVCEFFGQSPVWRCNEDYPPKRKTSWRGATYLCLYTHYSLADSPLVRGDSGDVVSLYRVPITDRDRVEAYVWQRLYRSLDDVYMATSDLEMEAYRALADLESDCSIRGRELCLIIETATNVPTYYYLKRNYGREDAEEKKRQCPDCGKPWFVEHPERKTFWKYNFMCEECRLISDIAETVDIKYASIGEPRKAK